MDVFLRCLKKFISVLKNTNEYSGVIAIFLKAALDGLLSLYNQAIKARKERAPLIICQLKKTLLKSKIFITKNDGVSAYLERNFYQLQSRNKKQE